MKINQKELLKVGTPKYVKPKKLRIKDDIIKFVKKHPNCTQAEILRSSPHDVRAMQRTLIMIITEGIISTRKCECMRTNFYKYIRD